MLGYLGDGSGHVVVQREGTAYVGFGRQLAVLDVADPRAPARVGFAVFPEAVLDVTVSGTYAYVATGRGGLYVVDLSDPSRPTSLQVQPAASFVDGVIAQGGRLYVSDGVLRVLDLSEPASPRVSSELGSPDPARPLGRLAAVADGRAFTLFYGGSDRQGGFRVIDISNPGHPVPVGLVLLPEPVVDLAVSRDHVYLLAGQEQPRLLAVDISDPAAPVVVEPDDTGPWPGNNLALAGSLLYLGEAGDADGGLTVVDVGESAQPDLMGRYSGSLPPVADIALDGDYAYLATADGLTVIEVANPAAMAETGSFVFDRLPAPLRGVAVRGSFAFVAAGEAGLQVVELADPTHPRVVATYDSAGHTWDVALAGRYVYLADEYNGLRILDLEDPLAPVEVGFFDPPGQEEFFHGVASAGGRVYVADGGIERTGLWILDLTDPAQPAPLGFWPLTAPGDSGLAPRAEDVDVAGEIAYVAAGTAGLSLVDVGDPRNPVEIGAYDTPGRAAQLQVVEGHVFLVDGDLRVVDVSDPTAPSLVGFYDLGPGSDTPQVVVAQGYAFVTAAGIEVLDVTEPAQPVKVAAHPLPSGAVAFQGTGVTVAGEGLFTLRTLSGPDLTAAPDTLIWPALIGLEPAQAGAGQGVHVIGQGGYLLDARGGYNESARAFPLLLDGAAAGELVCYVNHCEGELALPDDVMPGTHKVSTPGGSDLSLSIPE
jgi:hypothetical protein